MFDPTSIAVGAFVAGEASLPARALAAGRDAWWR